ncbi:lipid IV(A) 3-deoxy-D-manno-octulosonic acid transferase [Porticoccus sp. W117]|uniref:lipid IV(A) 3-deoxy-D-manno-octulosonic acid transferase n=1 Tax=Porticoccus sp. W117 TaxID=3054777 RepID=UPI00259837C1|nr:lipid IV(A) 3-deoxy-D-manno-octulosonic acid transferase [Porticoccus sp. W117]MDM3872295.1 lipid IV(A) 3-deoxy-D-manno-octulosonic acid transferase [Porticoccus sp. W117]
MIRALYTIAFYLAVPLVLLRLLLRGRKAPAYRKRWGERFGFVPRLKADKVIWVHSVSVGETLAAVPLIKQLQQRYPNAQLVVTTMTPTGSERVVASFGDSVYHVYAPYDLPDVVARFLKRVQPDVLVIMETELWPNLVLGCAKRDIPVVVANARLSQKSADGYAKMPALMQSLLANISAVAAQHSDDGQRFLDLGLPEKSLSITGNIKFDLLLTDDVRQKANDLKQQWRGDNQRPVWLVASTHRGEDEVILDSFQELLKYHDDLLLVLVPRHPERFDEVAQLCESRKLTVTRRSEAVAPADSQVLLGDTMGELLAFCGASDVVFMGGSLVPVGGHNLIEPAAWGVPVLSGSHLFNFAEASRLLLSAEGMVVCDNSEQIAAEMESLLNDPQRRVAMGEAAQAVAEQNRGALQRLMTVIEDTSPSP